MDRNQLEQEALRQLNLGSQEGALRAYIQILKLDGRDRRIRQKIGELYLKLGRNAEAEKQFREVADGLVKEGSLRAAVSVLKQLVALRPDDPALQMELAECYLASGYANDARAHLDTAMRLWIGAGRALDAARAARRTSELSPGETVLRLKLAELLEAGGDAAGAATAYREVTEEYRRRGRPDEVGRVAEMALRLVPDDLGLLLDAAAARVEAGEHKRALTHLQLAFSHGPREPRTLDLLARSLEGVEQPDKALKVLAELARVAGERGDLPLEADALRRASRLAPQDTDLADRLAVATERVSRMERRLTELALAQPSSEAELRAQVRAETYLRYGFADRAEAVLREALVALPDALPLLAALAEVEVARGQSDAAIRWIERIIPRAGDEAAPVLERLGVLRGVAPAAAAPVAAAPAAPPSAPAPSAPGPVSSVRPPTSPASPPSVAPASLVSEAEARGDRLIAQGDIPGAFLAWREVLAADPMNQDVLAKIAELRGGARDAAARQPEPEEPPSADEDDAFADFEPLPEGTFTEIVPDALDEVGDDAVEEARELVAVGMWADALAVLEGASSLDAAVLRAQAMRGMGEGVQALDSLRSAVNDALESDPAYCDALFELSALYTATGKARAAVRLLEEIKDLDENYRIAEVDARMRGLQRILK